MQAYRFYSRVAHLECRYIERDRTKGEEKPVNASLFVGFVVFSSCGRCSSMCVWLFTRPPFIPPKRSGSYCKQKGHIDHDDGREMSTSNFYEATVVVRGDGNETKSMVSRQMKHMCAQRKSLIRNFFLTFYRPI